MNRQGRDMAEILDKLGFDVTLVQPRKSTLRSKKVRVIEVKGYDKFESKRVGGIPGSGIALLTCLFIKASLFPRARVIVAVTALSLIPAVLCALLSRGRLVYYSLEVEHGPLRIIEKWCCRWFVDGLIGVEDTRLQLLLKTINRSLPSFVLYNMPPAGITLPNHGRLRNWLEEQNEVEAQDRIVLFHGSYQKYMYLETIVQGTIDWDPGWKLVIMMHGEIPSSFLAAVRRVGSRVVMVPPVSHVDLFSWVVDADVGLLPYEDTTLLAVRYCSPQKLFDLLACGIPFVGSKRPLIEKIASEVGCGLCVDMRDSRELSTALRTILSNASLRQHMSCKARTAYESKYNYEALGGDAIRFASGQI